MTLNSEIDLESLIFLSPGIKQTLIVFSVFGKSEIIVNTVTGKDIISFDALVHVQQPMIEKVVQYFLGNIDNPCPPEEGVAVLNLMDCFVKGNEV